MEVYILDSSNRPELVIDQFVSLIWTERFRAIGDFELKLISNSGNRSRLAIGQRIVVTESYRIMTVETVEDSLDSEGRAILTVTGRSMESVTANRLARGTLGDLTATPKWSITDLPADIVRYMFHQICVVGVLDAGDIIAGINEGSTLFPADTIDEPTDTVTYEIDPMTLYQAMGDLAEMFFMGFRLVWDPVTYELWFDVYMGSDRTTDQTTLPAVVFAPSMENLRNSTELRSVALYKNVAYVLSPVGSEVVYALDVDPAIAGFERRAMFLKADDITDVIPADATDKMIQRGLEELSKNRKIAAFDGEIPQTDGRYHYMVDYNLGDLAELQNDTGGVTIVQITEQIFVSDSEGDRSYPTLTVQEFVTPGSIDAWAPDEVIDDVDPGLVIDDA